MTQNLDYSDWGLVLRTARDAQILLEARAAGVGEWGGPGAEGPLAHSYARRFGALTVERLEIAAGLGDNLGRSLTFASNAAWQTLITSICADLGMTDVTDVGDFALILATADAQRAIFAALTTLLGDWGGPLRGADPLLWSIARRLGSLAADRAPLRAQLADNYARSDALTDPGWTALMTAINDAAGPTYVNPYT